MMSTSRLQPRVFRKRVAHAARLAYLLYLPNGYQGGGENWPLVLFLHGAGERGDDLDLLKVHGPPKRIEQGHDYPCIIAAPQCPAGKWWTWLVPDLHALLDDLIARFRVDADRVYVTGISMGGEGTWALAADRPERFAAIVPICGPCLHLWSETLTSVPAWCFHGEKDDLVLPRFSHRMVDAIRARGGRKVKLTTYPDAGHDSWTATYDNPAVFRWLLRHKRPAKAK